jgi:hypothetical protein
MKTSNLQDPETIIARIRVCRQELAELKRLLPMALVMSRVDTLRCEHRGGQATHKTIAPLMEESHRNRTRSSSRTVGLPAAGVFNRPLRPITKRGFTMTSMHNATTDAGTDQRTPPAGVYPPQCSDIRGDAPPVIAQMIESADHVRKLYILLRHALDDCPSVERLGALLCELENLDADGRYWQAIMEVCNAIADELDESEVYDAEIELGVVQVVLGAIEHVAKHRAKQQ